MTIYNKVISSRLSACFCTILAMVLMCCTHSVSAQEVHAEQPLGLTQFQDTTATVQPVREFAEQDVPSPADSTLATSCEELTHWKRL